MNGCDMGMTVMSSRAPLYLPRPQEMRDCPAALLVVASTSDPNPIAAFHELASASALPRPFMVGDSLAVRGCSWATALLPLLCRPTTSTLTSSGISS